MAWSAVVNIRRQYIDYIDFHESTMSAGLFTRQQRRHNLHATCFILYCTINDIFYQTVLTARYCQTAATSTMRL